MTRTVLFDSSANEELRTLLDTKISKTGLLIGSIDKSTDYILFVVPTSKEDNDDAQGNENSETWIINHALHIHDMLVGGMDILGLYCVDMKEQNCRNLLVSIFKSLHDYPYYKQMNFNTDRLLWVADSNSKNVTMKTVDINDPKKPSQKCDMNKRENLLNEFEIIKSNFNIDTTFTMPNDYNHDSLKTQFFSALSNDFMFENDRYMCLINNHYAADENKRFKDLEPQFKVTAKANENSAETQSDEYFATFLENLSISQPKKNSKSSTELKETAKNLENIYHVTGVSSSLVLINRTSTMKFIKQTLICDVMRSLFARMRLLTEDLDARKDIIGESQLEDPNSMEESYQTPNRIFISVTGTKNKIFISDYVFPDEQVADISERVRELFNYEITDATSQILYMESFPPEIRISQLSDECSTTKKDIVDTRTINSNMKLLLSLLVGIVAILVSLFMLYFSK